MYSNDHWNIPLRKWAVTPGPKVTVCGLSLHLGSSESHRTQEKNCSFNSALSTPAVSTSAFRSTNLFLFNTNSVVPFSACKPIHKLITPQIALTKGSRSKIQLLNYLWWPIYVINSVEFAKSPCNYHTESTYAVQYWGPILIQVRL